MDVLQIHRALVEIPSPSREEGPIMDFAWNLIGSRGFEPRRLDDNVWFTLGSGEHRLLLATHLDVVPPSADHPYPPFRATLKDGKVYGRGSVDAKASAAAMMVSLFELADEGFEPPDGQVVVALTACEEVGGAYNGLEQLRRGPLASVSSALVGEPTELRPCVAQKGLLILKLLARGRTAHAARAHLGENALYKAARDLLRIEAFTFEREDPYLGAQSMVASVIEGGTAHNVVPDSCTITVDIRSTPAYTHDEIVDSLREILESEISVHSSRYIPVGTAIEEPIVRACIGASSAEPFGSPTASDWIFLGDVPTVKIGPGKSELSHAADEHVATVDIEKAVRLYKDVIKRYFEQTRTEDRTPSGTTRR